MSFSYLFSPATELAVCLITAAILSEARTASAWVFGNNHSYSNSESMSADGRYVAFQSDATNLVPNDTNGQTDIFRLDTQTGAVVRVSVSPAGSQATGGFSSMPSINADGTRIAFLSTATNLVAGDTNAQVDVFLRDLTAGTTVRVNLTESGGQTPSGRSFNPSISGDGTKVAFSSESGSLVTGDTNGQTDVFLRDVTAATTVRVSLDSSGNQVAVGGSYNPSISSDGTKVAFDSGAATFVPDDTNLHSDVFVRDLAAGTTVRVSVDSAGNQSLGNTGSYTPSLNSDGTKVAFTSTVNNLVPGDTNGQNDVFLHDLSTSTTVRLSVDSAGNQATGWGSSIPSISADGTKVAFLSEARNLVAGDTNNVWDIFVRDLATSTTVRASVTESGNQANNYNDLPSISADGTRVAFTSVASNLVDGDTNSRWDVYVRDLAAGSTSVPVKLSGFAVE